MVSVEGEERTNPAGISYPPEAWLSAWVWVTAAVAIHNFQQSPWEWSEKYKNKLNRLSLDEDPLAYLGILVDILEEWDRFSVVPTNIFTNTPPVQGNDVLVSNPKNSPIVFSYPSKIISKKVKDSLNSSLKGWQNIVKIDSQ